jgi:Acetyltransferase (GNAT) family
VPLARGGRLRERRRIGARCREASSTPQSELADPKSACPALSPIQVRAEAEVYDQCCAAGRDHVGAIDQKRPRAGCWPDGRCAVVSVAIDHEQRGRGHGSRALRLLLHRAFAGPDIDHAEMRTDRSANARRLAKRAGFVLEAATGRQATYRLERSGPYVTHMSRAPLGPLGSLSSGP